MIIVLYHDVSCVRPGFDNVNIFPPLEILPHFDEECLSLGVFSFTETPNSTAPLLNYIPVYK